MARHHTAFADTLRSRGLKATPQRIQVLTLLAKSGRPVGVPDLVSARGGEDLDTVTVYRSLEALANAQIVRRVDLRHGHTDYELVYGASHHHHLVCEQCGRIESIDWCPDAAFEKKLLKSSSFSKLSDHSLEFFGICKKCASTS